MRPQLACMPLIGCCVACTSGEQVLGREIQAQHAFDAAPLEQPAPWFGGPEYYAQWSNGPSTDANRFPLGVWLQNPRNVSRFQAVGINFYMGLWKGPTDEQLDLLGDANMPATAAQEQAWQSHLDNPTLQSWLGAQAPDNAQELSDGSFGPCIEPEVTNAQYANLISNDSTRPVTLLLGRGTANPDWVGRGSCRQQPEMYLDYVLGGDILGFHVHPLFNGDSVRLNVSGMQNMNSWTDHEKPVYLLVEASSIDGLVRPAPAQIRTQVWLGLVHHAAGIVYFCHQVEPDEDFNETDCLDHEPTAEAITQINRQVMDLAPVLNAAPLEGRLSVSGTVDSVYKRHDGWLYIFAVAHETASEATFTLNGYANATVEVIDEGRNLPLSAGSFTDSFEAHAVHLYRLPE